MLERLLILKEGGNMGKHHDKIAAALEVRKANHKGPGGKVPGSMNKKKTGYRSIKSNEAKRLLSK